MTDAQSRTPAKSNRGPRAKAQGKRPATEHGTDALGLAPPHTGLIHASAIDPRVASARGYKSVAGGEGLGGYGFTQHQRRTGLLIPIWDVNGEEVTAQLRPDVPRKGANDKPIKYETPRGKTNVLDVHPHVRHHLADPSVPLWITEGVRKADSAVSRDLCCIALTGVWNWRGTNAKGGATVLPDWESIALKDREVFVVFDSDVMTKAPVHAALGRLKGFLDGRGANVHLVYLPAGGLASHSEKVGLDDFFRGGGTVAELEELAVDELRMPDSGTAITPPAEWPVPEGFEIPAPWKATEEGIVRIREGLPIAVAHSPVVITGRLVDDQGGEAVEISWLRDGAWRSRVFNRDVLFNTRKIIDLAAQGVSVTSANSRDLASYLSDIEAANIGVLPRKAMTGRVGWFGEDFICGESDDVVLQGEGMEATFAAYRKEGTFDAWQETVARLEEHPRAALGIYAALAAVLLRVFDVPPFFVDLSGQTSTGKTTTLKLGASVWGSEDLVDTWDATAVAIETKVGAVDGVPVFLDETKRAKSPETVAEIIYEVSQGVGRARGAKAGGLRPTLRWSTIVVSTGEQPLTSFTQDGGTRARVVSVWGSPFETEDRHLVLDLTAAVARNFGHAGPEFVKQLLERRDEWEGWRERFEEIADQLAARASSVVGERRSRYVALLRFTAGLAKMFRVVEWQPTKAWWDALLINGAADEDDDQPAIAFEEAWHWAASNKEKFWSEKEWRQEPKAGWNGRWSGRPDHAVAFRPDTLRVALSRGGHDYTATVKAWADRGWIDHQDGKHTRVIKIEKNATRLVVMKPDAVAAVINPSGDGDSFATGAERKRTGRTSLRVVRGEKGA